jgi:hypothetical protein
MKNLLLLIIALNVYAICLTQTTSPAVIISSGTLTKGEDASLSWTIGESLIESYGEGDLLLLQGFQEIEDFVAAIEDDVFSHLHPHHGERGFRGRNRWRWHRRDRGYVG